MPCRFILRHSAEKRGLGFVQRKEVGIRVLEQVCDIGTDIKCLPPRFGSESR